MARLTVEDCLDHVDNLYDLVMLASKRARQLSMGADPLVSADNDKPTVIALREIAESLVTDENVDKINQFDTEDEFTEDDFNIPNAE